MYARIDKAVGMGASVGLADKRKDSIRENLGSGILLHRSEHATILPIRMPPISDMLPIGTP
jgi:hypothetical protein